MKTISILIIVFWALWGATAYAQPNPIGLDSLDGFSLAREVVRNRELRVFLRISENTNDKIRDLLQDPAIATTEKRVGSIQSFGGKQRGGSSDSVAKLEASFFVRLQIAVPEYKANEVRIWALKAMFSSPEHAFTSPKVYQYLELDGPAINSLKNVLASERISFEDLRNRLRLERAKAIVEDLSVGAQVLFTRYAGSELLKKFEVVAEQEGPLEFKCYAVEWTNTMVNLCNNPILHKHLRLSPDQVAEINSIEAATIQQIFAIDRRSKNLKEEQSIIDKRSFKEVLSLLTERQLKRLQQWVALEFFIANPKRELSREDLRKYLGLNELEDWKSTLRLVEERDSQLVMQLAQLNAVVAGKLLSALPEHNREIASQLFKGVW